MEREAECRIDRSGDPDDWIDAAEFARILGWTSGRTAVTSTLARRRLAELRPRVCGPAANLMEGLPRPINPPTRPAPILRRVAEALVALSPTDVSFVPGLAEKLGVAQEVVYAALEDLSRPVRARRRVGLHEIPDPDDPNTARSYDRPRWRRSTAWIYADGLATGTMPSPSARYASELYALAERAVLEAIETGECLTAEKLAVIANIPSSGTRGLEPARTLLSQAVARLRTRGQVDLRTRAEIREAWNRTANELVAALRRKHAPQPVVQVNRLYYYRGADLDAWR